MLSLTLLMKFYGFCYLDLFIASITYFNRNKEQIEQMAAGL